MTDNMVSLYAHTSKKKYVNNGGNSGALTATERNTDACKFSDKMCMIGYCY